MDDIKLFAKNEKELETLIQTVRIYSQHIEMEFGIEKCAMLVIKSSKRHMTEGVELPNQEKLRTLGEKETYKYLGMLEADAPKQVRMKGKLKKSISEVLCRNDSRPHVSINVRLRCPHLVRHVSRS